MNTSFEITTDYIGISLLAFIPGVIGLAISIYMWLKIPRTTTTTVFLVFVISCSVWQISEGFFRLSGNEATAIFWNRCISLSIIPCTAAGLHFSVLFSGNKRVLKSRLFYLFIYLPAVVFFGALILNIYTWPVITDEVWNWKSDPRLGTFQSAETLWVFCTSTSTMYFLARYAVSSRKKDLILRRRSLILFIGYLIPSAIGVVCQIIFPQVLGLEEMPLTAPAILTFSIASLIALQKYKLFRYSSAFPANRILEIMNEGVLILDTELRVRYANLGFSRITGYCPDELTGMSVHKLGPGYLNVKDQENEAKPTGVLSERTKRRIRSRDGSDRFVYYNSAAYIDKSGDITGTIILFTDITEIEKSSQKARCEKRQALQHQSKLLSSQLNPHFIYNSLNSIQYYILDENREPALNYISEFSKLMRTVLNNSLKEYITLSDEISFLEAYISLELKRLRNKFSYIINVSSEIDTDDVVIPPMLLQPYVENSIVHGLGLIDYQGILVISFALHNDRVVCEIVDNGVGRETAIHLKENRKGGVNKSHGMNITKTRIEILNEISEQDHHVHVEDLKDENQVGIGTKIIVSFPLVQC
ncbi:MAG: histidine kinase [Bacteroidetes bacterium]|nr:histidine kinase [Bacteroidota bacterium]